MGDVTAHGLDAGRQGVRARRCPGILEVGSYPREYGGAMPMKYWDREKGRRKLEVLRTRTFFPLLRHTSSVCLRIPKIEELGLAVRSTSAEIITDGWSQA